MVLLKFYLPMESTFSYWIVNLKMTIDDCEATVDDVPNIAGNR